VGLGIAALLPILLVLLLMLALRWSAARAGLVGVGLAVLIAVWWFGFGFTPGEPGLVNGSLGVVLEAGFSALTILWIIFPALCIHQLQLRTGALVILQRGLGQLSDNPRILVLLVAWFFALFIEGAAGFGTSAALAAPFLVSVGFAPVQAVSIALVGHAVGVSFGAVGTPVAAQAATSGLSGLEIGAATAPYHLLLGWMIPFVLLILAGSAGRRPRPSDWGWAALAGLSFLLPYFLLAKYLGPELPTLGGALAGGLVFVWALRLRRTSQHSTVSAAQVVRAAAPYLVLVGLVLLTRLVPVLREALQHLELSWMLFGRFEGSFAPLYHPGTLLLIGFLAAAWWQRATPADLLSAVQTATLQLVGVALALLAMLSLSRLMVHADMIGALAEAAANALGHSWPLLAPWVGVLGTFVTGSATASNILFSEFQQATAQTLGLPVAAMLGAQGFGAAVGNIICPHNIIAAGATVALVGQEGAVLRKTLGICLLYVGLGGLLVWLFI
jgi:lactate permease